MKKLIYTIFFVLAFTALFTNIVYAEDGNTEPEIVLPDLVVNFDNDKYWYGLESGNTPYWKIEDGVGKFSLTSGTLSPGERQLESASLDLENW